MTASSCDIIFACADAVPIQSSEEISLLFVADGDQVVPCVRQGPRGPRLATDSGITLAGASVELSIPIGRPGEPLVRALLLSVTPDAQGVITVGLRQLGPLLPADEAAIAARAVALLNWHRSAPYCPACGGATEPVPNGVSRRCQTESCAREHFPRLDLVVMTLPVDGEWCLLGRQQRFPEGFYSGFAGFAEPGETLEQAARRETREEAGVTLISVDFRFSQPWPFPHAVTTGFRGQVADRAAARADCREIAEVRWFHRSKILEMLNSAEQTGQLRMPGRISLAHQLARDWLMSFS